VGAIAEAQRRRIAIQPGPEHLPQGGAAEPVALSILRTTEALRTFLFAVIEQRYQRPSGVGPCGSTAIDE
jgi:hypothetical protein